MTELKNVLIERLFAQHRSALQSFFYRRIRSKPDAVDLVQEVYVRMLRVNDTDAIRNPEGYLYTVANNLAIEHAVLERRHSKDIDFDQPVVEAELLELLEEAHVGEDRALAGDPGEAHRLDQAEHRVLEPPGCVVQGPLTDDRVGVDAHETRPTPPMATGWCSCASLLRQFIKAEPVSSRAIEMHFNCRLRLMCIDSSPSERLRAHRACSQKLGSSS